jgi:hypothetical protein
MQRLSCYPHPRDKGACLPKISSPHSEMIVEKILSAGLPVVSMAEWLDNTNLKEKIFILKIF